MLSVPNRSDSSILRVEYKSAVVEVAPSVLGVGRRAGSNWAGDSCVTVDAV